MALAIGTRVRLIKDIGNYPSCYIKAGETGTLVRIEPGGQAHWILLDANHRELEGWENQVEVWDSDDNKCVSKYEVL